MLSGTKGHGYWNEIKILHVDKNLEDIKMYLKNSYNTIQ